MTDRSKLTDEDITICLWIIDDLAKREIPERSKIFLRQAAKEFASNAEISARTLGGLHVIASTYVKERPEVASLLAPVIERLEQAGAETLATMPGWNA